MYKYNHYTDKPIYSSESKNKCSAYIIEKANLKDIQNYSIIQIDPTDNDEEYDYNSEYFNKFNYCIFFTIIPQGHFRFKICYDNTIHRVNNSYPIGVTLFDSLNETHDKDVFKGCMVFKKNKDTDLSARMEYVDRTVKNYVKAELSKLLKVSSSSSLIDELDYHDFKISNNYKKEI